MIYNNNFILPNRPHNLDMSKGPSLKPGVKQKEETDNFPEFAKYLEDATANEELQNIRKHLSSRTF